MKKITLFLLLSLVSVSLVFSQNRYELDNGWKCIPISKTKETGEKISTLSYPVSGWQNAVVPGTVLTTQLANKEIPDPFFGMNNELIPDIYETGRDYYTYWFVKDFQESMPQGDEQVWLTFRGINYSCEIYLNGAKVNEEKYEGMFLRNSFNITNRMDKSGKNRLAVIVYPPDPVGEPNGGQGGDGRIAKNVTHQYVAGWDWIQPVRDRNTGIWDKVYIEKTGKVNLKNPHVVTLVPGKRMPDAKQDDAIVKISAELENTSKSKVSGVLGYEIDGEKITKKVSIDANSTVEIELPDHVIQHPRLWWPSGYGSQDLYDIKVEFKEDGGNKASDFENVQFGIREIQTIWNAHTLSKEIYVNGQPIFIKGGNWIVSDAMLRFSDERYDAEIRYHKDMNLNLIRIWGGALTERPEFYKACDKYGLLVIQDFWFSGDCNGRWRDPKKAEDQLTRRKYPDDHGLALESAVDMIKMIRNHPSLAMWCGGNEIIPPVDILIQLRDSILPVLDGTRWFADYSNSDEWSLNFLGGNGDGPYSIQPLESFWEKRTWPFNSEVGSVGTGDYESLVRFLPEESLVAPRYNPDARFKEDMDSVWTYHKYSGVGYVDYMIPYGEPKDIRDFALKAQLLNYDQYRALIEGFSSHIWDWYTGTIIWKTQNPWTSMRGQMYDCYLDPNAGLFGLRKGSELVHVMCNPATKSAMVVNNSFEPIDGMEFVAKFFDVDGNETLLTRKTTNVEASNAQMVVSLQEMLEEKLKDNGGFLYLQLHDSGGRPLSDNFYWYPNAEGVYSGLKVMKNADIKVNSKILSPGKMEVSLSNPQGNPVSFFNRIAITDPKTGERILPAFYSDNYISVIPGETKTITVEYNTNQNYTPRIEITGWNVNLNQNR